MDTRLVSYIEAFAPYSDLVRSGRFGFQPLSGEMQPWYLIETSKMFDANEAWSSGYTGKPLIAFARRQDCDDFACFLFENGEISGIELIEGWSGGSYAFIEKFDTFAEWMKVVDDDVAERRKSISN